MFFSAHRLFERNQVALGTAIARLSSGKRINSAADDAAGLAVSARLSAQVRSLAQAQRNGNDAVSLAQTAEGGLSEINEMLIRMRELALESSNGTLSNSERLTIDDEFDQLRSEINRIAEATEFDGSDLLDGDLSAGIQIQIGTGADASIDRISISIADSRATALGLSSGITLSTTTGAAASLSLIDSAIDALSDRRGGIGALQNRLTAAINHLAGAEENARTARSRIEDADIAEETAALTRQQILSQAGIAVMAQANAIPNNVLSLLT